MEYGKHSSTAAEIELKPCPFCGAPLLIGENIKENGGGGYELSHNCFKNKRGAYFAVSKIQFFGDSKKEVAELWNNRE